VFTEPRLVGALANSVIVSAATLVASLVLALPLAWGVARTRMPGKWMVNVAVTIAFVIPNFIGAIAWILLLGKNAGLLNVLARQFLGGFLFDIYSIPGLVLVLALSFFPIIYFSAQAALENIDPMYEEAAQMSGAPAWRASLGISLPLVLPAIVSSSVLVFLGQWRGLRRPGRIALRQFPSADHRATTCSPPAALRLAAASASPDHWFHPCSALAARLARGDGAYRSSAARRRARPVEIGWDAGHLAYAAVCTGCARRGCWRAVGQLKNARLFISRNF
jgi:iron(III) transport system permease protein